MSAVPATVSAALAMNPARRVIGAGGDPCGEPGVEVEAVEADVERRTVEVPGRAPVGGGDHPVRRGDEEVAGHRLQHLTEVDDERPRHRRDVDPVPGVVLHLQPCDGSGGQQREEAGVVVGVDTRTTCRGRRIVDQLGQRHRS